MLGSLRLLKGQTLVWGCGGWEEVRPSLGEAARPPSRGADVLAGLRGPEQSRRILASEL